MDHPPAIPVAAPSQHHVLTLLRRAPRWTVLTGAGISTDSGIPDYRDAAGAWKRSAPVSFQDFMGHASTRQRYWARSLAGWPVFSQARPNAAHQALAQLEARGPAHSTITQNVDGLHQRAGSRRVIDLHGRLDQLVCMGCGQRSARGDFQARLLAANPAWQHRHAPVAPDGDADLSEVDFSRFSVPPCPLCGGILKPDVVFYGENVPRPRVDDAMQRLAESELLLIVGSSLMVYSGLRFVHAAKQLGLPVVAINLGATRADAQLDGKWQAACAPALEDLAALL
ncbi:NAD-dependent deacetylase [Rhodococcus sp. SRB_17]|uniref:NAD-dependent protein deacetylase n=1 Tax=Acidovorax sp. SRB_24 TaxID=1962700 RepID=UPI00145FB148|nr:NAD-dependent protein deacetylase [Acidovorax sp. SRB_24]NMM78091.1 NAD-dependent deacetylase [Acidovorax sp. SRB_24]NMM88837.1 NAD-dependent deacetylase [Rhodococcus sp. SRB_17]